MNVLLNQQKYEAIALKFKKRNGDYGSSRGDWICCEIDIIECSFDYKTSIKHFIN